MKVLVIGGGGREHALVWKIAQSPLVDKIYCCPGNDAMQEHAELLSLAEEELLDFAKKEGIDLTIVGPEQPLVDGIVDDFKAAGLEIFGPTKAAAQLEGSKIFTKDFLTRHGIPTAAYKTFTDATAAFSYIEKSQGPWVIKADGLAAGKGVIICKIQKEAREAITQLMVDKIFGAAGEKILIEDMLLGEEGSFIVITDGRQIIPMASSQDHKAVYDGDEGVNTGGMGAYSPAPILEGDMTEKVMEKVIRPTIRGMAEEGIPYSGVLYAGLMIRDGEPYVLEFNVRFGDPETQPILTRMDCDIIPLLLGSASGKLQGMTASWKEGSAISVILAAGGYPKSYEKGKVISGLDKLDENIVVFHAGTKLDGPNYVTSGGRVMAVTATGPTLAEARSAVYEAVNSISFEDMHYRTDIGMKALQ